MAGEAAIELLGGAVTFTFEAADGKEQAPAIEEDKEQVEPERAPDPDQLEAAPSGVDDPTDIVLSELGGSVVTED